VVLKIWNNSIRLALIVSSVFKMIMDYEFLCGGQDFYPAFFYK